MSIVTAIAQAHRGRVSVGSAPGHGATFTITIPLTDSPPPQKDRRWPAS
ncbi:ATP-binding protein [Rhodococcus sp. BS-15]|nr:ATP-binding protein [Rhodococcus sp. BS-15]